MSGSAFVHDHPDFEALLSIVSERRGLSSALVEKDYWVHEHLASETSRIEFLDNRPRIHCVLPEVTLLEKIEAISRRYGREPFEPASVVRHYEDVMRILTARKLDVEDIGSLLAEMLAAGDIRDWSREDDPAFTPDADAERWEELEKAWEAIGSLFWGERVSLVECVEGIRGLLRSLPG